jgi:hypothetical protein
VTWPNDLKQELAERWIESSSADRARLVKLNSLVDRELAVNADQRGRPLGDDPTVRVWTIGGARVVFEVNASDRIVRVLMIRALRSD